MFSLLLLILSISLSGVVTRIGAIALEITGMKPNQANFQATSAFSGTGFTTLEAEHAVNHPQRREIIRTLIRYGNAGVITTMATLVGTLVAGPELIRGMAMPTKVLHPYLPISLESACLIAVIVLIIMIQRFLSQPAVSRLIKELVTQWLLQGKVVNPVQFQELNVCINGFGLIEVEICEQNPLLGKTLAEANLSALQIEVLNVDKLSESITRPTSDYRIELGDRLLCFGPLRGVRQRCTAKLPDKPKTKGLLNDQPLALGSKAPAFILTRYDGQSFRLSDYANQHYVVLIFYPKDQSFTCSAQLKKFDHPRANHQWEELETVVVAINPESKQSHQRFAASLEVSLPILTDPGKKVSRAYKAIMLGGLLVNRTVYVIDKTGHIIYAQRGNPPVSEVIRAIQYHRNPTATVQDSESCSIQCNL